MIGTPVPLWDEGGYTKGHKGILGDKEEEHTEIKNDEQLQEITG